MQCELTFHAEQRLRLRVSELRSSGVCDDDFEQEILKAIERACDGKYAKVRHDNFDQYVLCIPLSRCASVTVIIIYALTRHNGGVVRTARRYCIDLT